MVLENIGPIRFGTLRDNTCDVNLYLDRNPSYGEIELNRTSSFTAKLFWPSGWLR
jgi:hypothetical protein